MVLAYFQKHFIMLKLVEAVGVVAEVAAGVGLAEGQGQGARLQEQEPP